NGPMRTVEANTPSSPVVTAALTTISAAQPAALPGGCQFQVASAASVNAMFEATSEYQVTRRASTPCTAARGTSSITTRQQGPASAATMPLTASAGGCAPIISASPRNAATAARAPRQVPVSKPIAAAMRPVSSG